MRVDKTPLLRIVGIGYSPGSLAEVAPGREKGVRGGVLSLGTPRYVKSRVFCMPLIAAVMVMGKATPLNLKSDGTL